MKKGRLATGDGLQAGFSGAIHCARPHADNNSGRDESRPYAGRIAHHASRVTGFSLVAVLFLIVVVAALGAFAVRIGAGQQQTVNLALLGARALSAANSGIEFGANRAFSGGCASATSTTLNLTGAGLNGFTVDVSCVPTLHATVDNTTTYRVTATAYSGTYGQPDYVSRQVFATFSNAN
jgi:MSHA biogenesis protein MshP